MLTGSGIVVASSSSSSSATIPATAAAVGVPAGEEPGVAAVWADRTEEVLWELVQDVATVAHPHRPLHPELRQGHAVARTPVAVHEPAISGNRERSLTVLTWRLTNWK